jgi:hypothetical protein
MCTSCREQHENAVSLSSKVRPSISRQTQGQTFTESRLLVLYTGGTGDVGIEGDCQLCLAVYALQGEFKPGDAGKTVRLC